MMKYCHFNKSRQYGIRQNGTGNMVFGNLAMLKIINNLADKISVSAYINLKLCPISFFVYVSFINHECLYC